MNNPKLFKKLTELV